LAGNPRESSTQTYTVPDGKPHLCLFAEAWSSLDPSTKPGNAILDRHWGQQNLQIHVTQPGQRLVVPFAAVGQLEAEEYTLTVRQLPSLEGDHPFALPGQAIRLLDPERGGEPAERLFVSLRPHERRPFVLSVEVPGAAAPGTAVQLLVEQA